MPGRLMAEHDPSQSNGTIAGQRKPNSETKLPNGLLAGHDFGVQSEQRANAQPTPLTNGVSPSAMDSGSTKTKPERSIQELPPEIAQITVNFQPLSKLFARAAQECFNSLSDTITALADGPEQVQVNGHIPSASNPPTAAASAHKRIHWLNFANVNRERFIKLLVLLQWSRHVGEVSKIIDLFAWMREQEAHYIKVDDMMGYLKREMHPEKIPSPDLVTALEMLSTGKSSQMPDLGYLPPDPLSASELLRTLKTINTLLHIRLNLHETLPKHFRTFRIASGRAIFTVPAEFEVDLSIADEDPNTQFYFIDFRFLFSPNSELPAGQLRSQLELRVNEVLASSGLSGCYYFFHDFVLTHKINILRRQALDLSRSRWAGSLRIEQQHRSLVVQYWLSRAGTKSWIEIGVNSGRQKTSTSSRKRDEQPQVALRWVRGAKDAEDVPIPEPILVDLNMELLLRNVVSQHVDVILSSIQRKLEASGCSVDYKTKTRTGQAQLDLPLSFSGRLSVDIEPTTGRLVLSPATAASIRYEETINELKNPAEQADGLLLAYKVSETSAAIREAAARSAWDLLPRVDSKVARLFSQSPIHAAARAIFFKPWPNSSWAVATLVSPVATPTWWIARVNRLRTGDGSMNGVENVDFLPIEGSADIPLRQAFFSNILRLAVSRISFQANTRRLSQLAIPYSVLTGLSNQQLAPYVPPILLIRISALVGAQKNKPSFVAEHITLAMPQTSTFVEGRTVVAHVAKGTMIASQKFLKLLKAWQIPDVSFDQYGGFALRIQSNVDSASAVVDLVISRLSSLCRLRSCLEILKSRNLKCTTATPDKICFIHASSATSKLAHGTSDLSKVRTNGSIESTKQSRSPETTGSENKPINSADEPLSAEINFTPGATTVDFYPTVTNPLNHLRPLFTQLLNRSANPTDADIVSAFSDFTRALPIVLPLIRASSLLQGQALLHMHSLADYRLVYSRPSCSFTMRYQRAWRQSHLNASSWMWFIEQCFPSLADTRNEILIAALSGFWKREGLENEEGVVKLSAGVACSLDAVESVLKELDMVVNACAEGGADEEDYLNERPSMQQVIGGIDNNAPAAPRNEDKPMPLGLGVDIGHKEPPRPSSSSATSVPSILPSAVKPTTPQPLVQARNQTQAQAQPNGPKQAAQGQVRQKENQKEKAKGKANPAAAANANKANGPEIIMLDD